MVTKEGGGVTRGRRVMSLQLEGGVTPHKVLHTWAHTVCTCIATTGSKGLN